MSTSSSEIAYLVTGPTSGIGYRTAFALAPHRTVVLVGRNPERLAPVRAAIEAQGGRAAVVVCDMSDLVDVRRAAAEIAALPLRIAGVLNNAGVMATQASWTRAGWDTTFATNYLGPFALIEALAPGLPDGANCVFVASAIEDPDRAPAKVMGMKGGRFISVAAGARGEWAAGGARIPGIDAYATSKQCLLAATFGLARENPRLRFNAVEPGITPGTGLGGTHSPLLHFVFGQVITRLPPFGQFRSTPEQAARVIARVLTDRGRASGVYFDEKGRPMRGSALAHDPAFQDRVIAETRAFLSSAGA